MDVDRQVPMFGVGFIKPRKVLIEVLCITGRKNKFFIFGPIAYHIFKHFNLMFPLIRLRPIDLLSYLCRFYSSFLAVPHLEWRLFYSPLLCLVVYRRHLFVFVLITYHTQHCRLIRPVEPYRPRLLDQLGQLHQEVHCRQALDL